MLAGYITRTGLSNWMGVSVAVINKTMQMGLFPAREKVGKRKVWKEDQIPTLEAAVQTYLFRRDPFENGYLTSCELAKELTVSKVALDRWVRLGRLDDLRVRFVGRWYWRIDDVEVIRTRVEGFSWDRKRDYLPRIRKVTK